MTIRNPPKSRPYTAYNIFFRLERMFLLQSMGTVDRTILSSYDPNHYDPLEHPRPRKYANVMLPPQWYSSRHKKNEKRQHRKNPGRIDMKTLSTVISANWRTCDPETKAYCKMLAMAVALSHKMRKNESTKKCHEGITDKDSSNFTINNCCASSSLKAEQHEIVESLNAELEEKLQNMISTGFDNTTKIKDHSTIKCTPVPEYCNDDPLMSDSLRHVDDANFNQYDELAPLPFADDRTRTPASYYHDEDCKLVARIFHRPENGTGLEVMNEPWNNLMAMSSSVPCDNNFIGDQRDMHYPPPLLQKNVSSSGQDVSNLLFSFCFGVGSNVQVQGP